MTLSTHSNDEIQFVAETEFLLPEQRWKVLIVDDEAEVHHVTRLALSDFTFDDCALEFLSAYSAKEAQSLIQSHANIAIVLLDVVMETENAGLNLVEFIREELDNALVRIILRTGQPGQAPEAFVAGHYGIDDYKTKTELTAQKLSTTMTTALRTFSTLSRLLDVSHALEDQIIQQKQAEVSLRMSEMAAIEKAQQLEGSLKELRQAQQSIMDTSDSNASQLLDPASVQSILGLTSSDNALQTLSTITRIARSVLRIADEQTAKLGISQIKLAALIYLNDEAQQSTRPSAIATHCGVSRAAVTGLLDGLEQDGYVERYSHPFDRRALTIKLTPKGQEFLHLICHQDQTSITELIRTLSFTDQKIFNDLLAHLYQLFRD